jgi:hypothetical protein
MAKQYQQSTEAIGAQAREFFGNLTAVGTSDKDS